MRPPRGGWLGIYSGLVYLFLYAPIVILVVFSFNRGEQTALWRGFTWDWYARLLDNPSLLAAARNSLVVALLTTAISTVIGTLAALGLAKRAAGKRSGGATRSLLMATVVVPEVVLGVALVTTFGLLGARLSLGTVVIGHVVFSVAYVTLVVQARLAGLDPALFEAAQDLGANPLETFRRVTLPLLLPGVIGGGLLVFTLSMDDYVVTSFVAGVGSTTLPVHLYSMLKVGVTPEVNALSTVLLVVTVALVTVAHRLLQQPSEGARK